MTGGLLNPAGALAFAAVGVLVALYLHGRRRRVVPVATLFLWRDVPASALAARRFRPDLLFAAQLAVLLALIGGYLRPYLTSIVPGGESARLLIVLDVSASMQAREAGGTRFELARGRARALVAQLLGGDEVMLVTAGERAHVVLRWTADHARAQDRLEALEALDTPTALAPALELALGEHTARPETRVFVLTDLPPEASGVARERLAVVDYVQIGRTDDNVAIAGLALDQPPFRPVGAATVTVLVRSYSALPRRVVLDARVGDRPWATRELALAARGTEHVLLTDPPEAGPVHVTLATDDALAVDDRAVGWLASDPPLDARVVTGSEELAAGFARLAERLPGARVRRGDDEDGARVAVLDGAVAEDVPTPALYVEPPPGHPVCPGAAALDDAAVVDWESEHPALRGLDGLQALTLAHARPLASQPWARTLVLAASERGAFPLLVAGERDGRRVACLGARPVTTSDGVPLLMLVLNVLRWLEEPPDAAPLVVETGVPVVAEGVHLDDAGDTGLHVTGDPPVVVAVRTGIHHLGTRVVAANLFDDRESDIGRRGGGEWAAATSRTTAVAQRELGWWLYVLATFLLALEWRVWRRQA